MRGECKMECLGCMNTEKNEERLEYIETLVRLRKGYA